MKRWLRRLLVIVAVLALIAVVGGRWFLHSSFLADRVRQEIEQLVGGPVKLAGIDAGFGGTTLRGLEFLEDTAGQQATPWLRIDQANADVTVWKALRGQTTPRQLTLTGATLTLRLDAAGNLLTHFPSPGTGSGPLALPDITLQQCQVIITRPGFADFVIGVPEGALRSNAGALQLTATATHPRWQTCGVDGALDAAGKHLTFHLKAHQSIAITQSMLEELPFVPPGTWNEVRLEGQSTADVALDFDLAAPQVHYRIALQPTNTRVTVPAMPLSVDDVAGSAVIEDGLVRLTGVHGRAYGGTLTADATLDFRGDTTRLHFQPLAVSKISVLKLPNSWHWPPQVEGLLSAKANLDVVLGAGPPEIHAVGKGQITEACVAGQSVADPVALAFDENLEVDLTLKKADVPAMLRNLGLTVPADVAGTLSLQVRASAPVARLGDPAAWHATSEVTAGTAQWSGLAFEDIRGQLALDDSGLSIKNLIASVAGGTLTGSGSVCLTGSHAFAGKLTLSHADMHSLAQRYPEANAALSPRGQVQAEAALSGTGTPWKLQVNGSADVALGSIRGVAFDELHVVYAIGGQHLDATDIDLRGPFGMVRGDARLALGPKEDSTARLTVHQLNVGQLAAALGSSNLPLTGRVDGTLGVICWGSKGESDRAIELDVGLQSRSLRVSSLPVEAVAGKVTLEGSHLEYDLKAQALGGRFAAKGQHAFDTAGSETVEDSGTLSFERIRLARLARALAGDSVGMELHGMAVGSLAYQHDAAGKLTGAGRLEVVDVGIGPGQRLGNIQAEVRLTGEEVRLQDVSGNLGQGVLQGHVTLPLTATRPGNFLVTLQGAEAADVLGPWLDRKMVQGPLAVRLSGQLGKQWSGSGHLMLEHGKVNDMDVTEWYLPVRWQWHAHQQRFTVDVSDSHAQLASGRATGSVALVWDDGEGMHLNGQVNYLGLQLRGLFPDFAATVWGSAQTSGRCEFSGMSVRSLNDVKISLDGQIKQLPARTAPVLGPILQALPMPGSWVVQRGEYRVLMDHGLIRVQKVALVAGQAHLFLHGTVSPAGVLQLDVMADPGHLLLDSQFAKLLGLRPSNGGPLPLQVLSQASSFLSKRLIAAHVTGTPRSPVVQIRPAPALTEDALRFFTQIGTP